MTKPKSNGITKTVETLTQAGLTTHEAFRVTGAVCTDGPLGADWKEGWAVHPFKARNRAHWWTRHEISDEDRRECDIPDFVVRAAERLCRIEDAAFEARRGKGCGISFGLLGPGNVPRCKLCLRARGGR
jgi:hypothetical protein